MNANNIAVNTDDHLDVLIIGAGISGIGIARYLLKNLPNKRFKLYEARKQLGGTWDLFRYPGIRSDSDLYTFGYEFKPWLKKKSIADASSIRQYLQETVLENGINDYIFYNQQVVSANWHSDKAYWEVLVKDNVSGNQNTITCSWLFSAGGYYRYDQGYTPVFKGIADFTGTVIHPQHWPENLNYENKRVLVIGSGATAMTLVPSMAKSAKHVTMLQRTPTYVLSIPAVDKVAHAIRKTLPEESAYKLIRYKNIHLARGVWKVCEHFPNVARSLIRKSNKKSLPKDYPVDIHFNPPYIPWDQRLCAVPDGDLFQAINDGTASIITDRIDRFTKNGVLLESGGKIEADIIITATGLNIQLFGGLVLYKDKQIIRTNKSIAYKGTLLSDIPNFAFAIGYTNASWTLKIGLISEYFCKLLSYMDSHKYQICEPVAPINMPTKPFLDFGAGYVKRAIEDLPKQGTKAPWIMSMDYLKDVKLLRSDSVYDVFLKFNKSSVKNVVESQL